MPRRCNPARSGSRSVPYADEPLRDPEDAVALVAAVASRPLRHELVVILLDAARCGGPVFAIEQAGLHTEATTVETVVDLVERLHGVEAMVLASVRPSGAVTDDDQLRWLEFTEYVASAGIELVDWFVFDGELATSLAVLTGSPDRW